MSGMVQHPSPEVSAPPGAQRSTGFGINEWTTEDGTWPHGMFSIGWSWMTKEQISKFAHQLLRMIGEEEDPHPEAQSCLILSGYSAAWQRVSFGTRRSQVRILLSRLEPPPIPSCNALGEHAGVPHLNRTGAQEALLGVSPLFPVRFPERKGQEDVAVKQARQEEEEAIPHAVRGPGSPDPQQDGANPEIQRGGVSRGMEAGAQNRMSSTENESWTSYLPPGVLRDLLVTVKAAGQFHMHEDKVSSCPQCWRSSTENKIKGRSLALAESWASLNAELSAECAKRGLDPKQEMEVAYKLAGIR